MTTLATASSITIAVPDGGTVTVVTNGGAASVTVTPVVGSVYTDNIGPGPFRKRYGPFTEGASLLLSNESAYFDYESSGVGTASTTSGIFRGPYTWAGVQALSSGLSVGDTVRITDYGAAPGAFFVWNGSAWIAMQPMRFDVANRVSGVAQTAEQMPAGCNLALPANFLKAFKAIDGEFLIRKTGTADALTLIVRIGTSATLTANTSLWSQANWITSAANTQRDSARAAWRIESTTSLRAYGSLTATGMEGQSSGGTTADQSAVTISDTSNALNLSVGCSLAAAGTDTPQFSVIWTLIP